MVNLYKNIIEILNNSLGYRKATSQRKHPSTKLAFTLDDDVNMERSSQQAADPASSSESKKWFDTAEEIPIFDWRDLEVESPVDTGYIS